MPARRSTSTSASRRSSAALLELENVVLAPHLGSATRETRTAMADLAVRNVLAVLDGQPAAHAAMTLAPAAEGAARPDSRAVMRRLGTAIDGLEEPAVEKIAAGAAGERLPGPDRDDAVGADAGSR